MATGEVEIVGIEVVFTNLKRPLVETLGKILMTPVELRLEVLSFANLEHPPVVRFIETGVVKGAFQIAKRFERLGKPGVLGAKLLGNF